MNRQLYIFSFFQKLLQIYSFLARYGKKSERKPLFYELFFVICVPFHIFFLSLGNKTKR